MSTHRFDAFVSAVTSECGEARDAVAAELRKQGLRVAVQSDFEQRPASITTLQKLHDYIRDCAEVHCIIGTRSGACPPLDAAAPLAHLLPPGITEASYTQWEYFFALHYVPDRLWLYIGTGAYQPDRPAPDSPDRPELQHRFVEHLRQVRGQDYAPFGNVDAVRAAVLEHEAKRRRAHGLVGADRARAGGGGSGEAFHLSVLANAIGGTIASLVATVLIWAATKWGGDVNPALTVLALLASIAGGVAFFAIYQRYAGILTRYGPDACAAYDRLRHQLAAGGLAAETYARRLTTALDAVDRFFGDAGMADRTLFPRAFGLRRPAPLWTAPAFDRCLLLALLYPIVTVFVVWAVSGHVGPAEHALMLRPDIPGWRPISALVAVTAAVCGGWLGGKANRQSTLLWTVAAIVIAGAGSLAGAGAFAGYFFGSHAGAVAGAALVAGSATFVSTLLSDAVAAAAFAGVVAVAAAVVGLGAAVGAAVVATAALAYTYVALAMGLAVGLAMGAVTVAVVVLNGRAVRGRWQGPFQAALVAVLILACFVPTGMGAELGSWSSYGSLLLFLGLLTLLNAPFDWASLGLTRALLRRGLELGNWWPYVLAGVDAAAAASVIALLTVVTVLGVQTFDTLAAFRGGDEARILPLGPLFDGIASRPAAPEFWWAYAMLLSTMIPSLVNLTIGGASLLRGIPWVTALLLRNMPERDAPPAFERTWLTLLLTLQVFLGGLLGIAAQGFLAYVVIGLVLPWLGLDLLDLARAVAAADLPGTVLAWVTWVPGR